MRVNVLVAILCLPCVAWALCGPGLDGHDSLDFNITVVHDTKTGCTTQRLPGITAPVIVCNGTNTAQCPPPVISTTGQRAGCASVTGVGSATFCNATEAAAGATGATGPKGATGAQGPLLTVSASPAPLCQLLTNGAGSFAVICNGTSNTTGATGPQGLQGPTGINGTVGATGAQGLTGFQGILPNYYILNPASGFQWSQVGINLALAAVSAAGGGVLYMGPCFGGTCTPTTQQLLVSDCQAPILVPNGVTLDLGGNQIQMSGDGTLCAPLIQMGTGTQTMTLNSQPLIANSTVNSLTVTIASSIGIANALAAGQLCTLFNGYLPGTVPSSQTGGILMPTARVASFVNSTGVITLTRPLTANFGQANSLTATISCWTGVSANTGVRGGYLASGGNTGAGSYFINSGTVAGTIAHSISDLVITGPLVANFQPLVTLGVGFDIKVENIYIDGFPGGVAIGGGGLVGGSMRNIHITNFGGGGLSMTSISAVTFQDCTVECKAVPSGRGILLVGSTFNTFKNIQITGGFSGILLAGKSYRNTFQSVNVVGTSGYGLVFSGIGDSYNQFYGVNLHNHLLGPIQFGPAGAGAGNPVGNYIDGDIQGAPVNNAPGGSGLLPDLTLNNMVRQTVNVNGFMALGLHNTTVSTTDFPANRHVIFSVLDEATLKVNYLSSTGVLKTATLGLS